MLLTNYIGVHNTRCWIQRVHSWVNTQLSNASGKHSGGIQVSKGSSRSRICQVISWYIDSLSRNKQPFIHMGKIFSFLYNQSGCKPLNSENDLYSGEKSWSIELICTLYFKTYCSENEYLLSESTPLLCQLRVEFIPKYYSSLLCFTATLSTFCRVKNDHLNTKSLANGYRIIIIYLYWCDGALSCGGNSFLHSTHISGKSWLVSHSWWNTSQQSRHLQKKRNKNTSFGLFNSMINIQSILGKTYIKYFLW